VSIQAAEITPARVGQRSIGPGRMAALLSVGTAVPEMSCSQQDFAAIMAEILNLKGAALERWSKIIAGSGIELRHGVMRPEEVFGLTTARRMQLYEQFAPQLAHRAATQAITAARIDPADVTDLIVVSCTGFSAPGVDAALVESLGLRRTVRRSVIGFMGCFGAIIGLRAAAGACAAGAAAGESSLALVVCVELCSLHIRADRDVQNQVASALFGDGAAAAVLKGMRTSRSRAPAVGRAGIDRTPPLGCVTTGASLLLPKGHDWMSWRITDAGFAMTLAREVPAALRSHLRDFLNQSGDVRPRTCIVHPGGPGILDAVNDALELGNANGLEHSRTILRRFGNMSSATVLFVLEEAVKCRSPLPMTILAFGPGLTIESLHLLSL
jgi:predicted naringenin-chalcone synthase